MTPVIKPKLTATVAAYSLKIYTKSLSINQNYNDHFVYFFMYIGQYSDFKPFNLKDYLELPQ